VTFTAKGTTLQESVSFELFVKIGCGSSLQGWAGKSQKVTRGSHRNCVSPLTQGLNYRSACDKLQFFVLFYIFSHEICCIGQIIRSLWSRKKVLYWRKLTSG